MSLLNYAAKVAGFSAGTILVAVGVPYLARMSPGLVSYVADFPIPDFALPAPFFQAAPEPEWAVDPLPAPPFVCDPSHRYQASFVSLDPLVVYIRELLAPAEIAALLRTAEPAFAPSEVNKHGRVQRTGDRTSSSAGLPRDDPAVMCVLARAREFMGTMLRDGWDEMGPVQLVRYRAGQRFNTHFDWYDTPRWANDNSPRTWNRVASFFVVLQDNCTGGETHFPKIDAIAPPSPLGEIPWDGGGAAAVAGSGDDDEKEEDEAAKPLWRAHEAGGLAFRPVAGNGIFWINLFPNGTGDQRTLHAGLPLIDGLKTAMNIWPRQYYPYDE